MDFKEFENKIKDINMGLFGLNNSDDLGSCTYANISRDQQSVLIIGMNPNTSKKNRKEKGVRKTDHPLIYVPDQDGSALGNFFKYNSYVWDYKKAYGLVGDKAKMFWSTDDVYLTEIANAYPDRKEEWENCYKDEKRKSTDIILIFADLFYLDEGTQTNVTDCLKNNRENTLKKVDEIIGLYIDFYKPKLIIVTNAGASRLIYDSQYPNDKNRNDMIDEMKFNNVTLLFSSMLTGQRALDNGSYFRLKRRINDLLK